MNCESCKHYKKCADGKYSNYVTLAFLTITPKDIMFLTKAKKIKTKKRFIVYELSRNNGDIDYFLYQQNPVERKYDCLGKISSVAHVPITGVKITLSTWHSGLTKKGKKIKTVLASFTGE